MHIQAESGIEAIVGSCFLDKAHKDLEALLLVEEAALALEVVGFEPGRQAGEECVLDAGLLLAIKRTHQIDDSAFGRKLLHLTIVGLDSGEQLAGELPHLAALMRED